MTASRISACGAFVDCVRSAGGSLHVHKRAVPERLPLPVPHRRSRVLQNRAGVHAGRSTHSFTPSILHHIEVWRHPCQHHRSPKQRSPASRSADRVSPLRSLRYLQRHRRDRRAPRMERGLQRVRLRSAFHSTRVRRRYHRSLLSLPFTNRTGAILSKNSSPTTSSPTVSTFLLWRR